MSWDYYSWPSGVDQSSPKYVIFSPTEFLDPFVIHYVTDIHVSKQLQVALDQAICNHFAKKSDFHYSLVTVYAGKQAQILVSTYNEYDISYSAAESGDCMSILQLVLTC